MLKESGSSMLMMFVFLNKTQQRGHISLAKSNPRVILLDSHLSNYFTCGRDVNNNPYIGVQPGLLPYFADFSWVEAAIDRTNGYLYLVAKNLDTHEVLMALGFKLRRQRLNIFCDPEVDDINRLNLNLKKVDIKETDGGGMVSIISDENVFNGIRLKEVSSPSELSSKYDTDSANELIEQSGLGQSFTMIDI
jgi:hypothetical protein